jgi:Ni,Fe-hydrogenase III small subunit
MPASKFVVAAGDDACGIGIMDNSYTVLGGPDKLFNVDLQIPINRHLPRRFLKVYLPL